MKTFTISKRDARRLAIHHSALNRRFPFGAGKNAVFRAIDHLGYAQIDTISVVARAHHHQLWSRVPDYRPSYLHDLQTKDKKVFEYWWHAAAFLPMKDYRFSLVWKHYFKDQKDGWPKGDPVWKKRVIKRIKEEGPLMARDFETDKSPKGGWWNWKPAKWALERLFLEGDLMVVQRQGFQKLYDLPERSLPGHVDTSTPGLDEYARYLIEKTLRAYGFARAAEIAYLRKTMGDPVRTELQKMTEEGELVKLRIKDMDQNTYFMSSKLIENSGVRIPKNTRILSPFDPTIIQRKRILNLFDFDYQIECYVPKPKRKFGYFCLPILFGDSFIGRMDCKADRKKKTFHLYHLVMEPSIDTDRFNLRSLEEGLIEFMEFNSCDHAQLHRVSPPKWKPLIEELEVFK